MEEIILGPENGLNYLQGDPDDIIPEEDLPFTRFRPEPEEETLDDIRTVEAWAVDIPDPRHITTMLKWLKSNDLESESLGHLRRIRKRDDNTAILLSTSASVPALPLDLNLSDPFRVTVPASAALTPTSLALKSLFWPTVYTPRRKGEQEEWTRGQVKWAWESMKVAVKEAEKARTADELPISAFVPFPHPGKNSDSLPTPNTSFIAHDTRRSSQHPLRHAAMNLIRKIADHKASIPAESSSSGEVNGTNYLLTSLTVFMTHEPCIMCSMALLHSRVKEVIYLHPMKKTGGCGGCACLPTLKGVNHRFSIGKWELIEGINAEGIQLDEKLDA